MTHSELRELNRRFGQAFGYTDDGQPRYKWVRSSELFFYRRGSGQTESGLYVPVAGYDRHSYAEMFGECWMLAAWRPPQYSEAQWAIVFGPSEPYPTNGTWRPIDGTQLPPWADPTTTVEIAHSGERVEPTAYAIHCIRTQMETPFKVFVDEGEALLEKAKADRERRTQDMVDSDWPAFDGVPGEKWHVSFPTPEPQIAKPAVTPQPNAE